MTRDKGFTLVELIAAMIISSIAVLAVGSMLNDFNKVILRGAKRKEMWQDYRFAKNMITRELIKADSNLSITGGGDGLSFVDKDGNTVNFVYDPVDKTLMITGDAGDALLLSDLEALQFSYGKDADSNLLTNLIEIHTEQKRASIYSGPSAPVMETSSGTFKVYLRSYDEM